MRFGPSGKLSPNESIKIQLGNVDPARETVLLAMYNKTKSEIRPGGLVNTLENEDQELDAYYTIIILPNSESIQQALTRATLALSLKFSSFINQFKKKE